MPQRLNATGSNPAMEDMDFSASATLANARAMNFIIRTVNNPRSGDRYLGFHRVWGAAFPYVIICPQVGEVPTQFQIEDIVVKLGEIGFDFTEICHFFDLKYSYLPHLDGWVMSVSRYCVHHRIPFNITPAPTVRNDIEVEGDDSSDYSIDVLSDVSDDPLEGVRGFTPPPPVHLEEQLDRPLGPDIYGTPVPTLNRTQLSLDTDSTPVPVWSPPPLRRHDPIISPPGTRRLTRTTTVRRGINW
jgi:hypothetical protein